LRRRQAIFEYSTIYTKLVLIYKKNNCHAGFICILTTNEFFKNRFPTLPGQSFDK